MLRILLGLLTLLLLTVGVGFINVRGGIAVFFVPILISYVRIKLSPEYNKKVTEDLKSVLRTN